MIGRLSKNWQRWLLLSTYLRTWNIVPNVHHSLQNRCSVWTPSKNSLSSLGNIWWCFVAKWRWRCDISLQFEDWPNNINSVCFDELPFWFLLPQILRFKWGKTKVLVRHYDNYSSAKTLFQWEQTSKASCMRRCEYHFPRWLQLMKERHVSITVMWQSDEQGKWRIKNISCSSVNKMGSPPGCWMSPMQQ